MCQKWLDAPPSSVRDKTTTKICSGGRPEVEEEEDRRNNNKLNNTIDTTTANKDPLSLFQSSRFSISASTMWQCLRPPSLAFLSTVWLALCSGLVWKYRELCSVFFAFCGSFALAAALRMMASAASTNSIISLTPLRIKSVVGLVACALQWYHANPSTTSSDNSSLHEAFSVAAGYLAFDHWYSGLYLLQPQNRNSNKPPWSVMEDAATLIALIVALVCMMRWRRGVGSSTLNMQDERMLEDGATATALTRTVVAAWTVYKMFRFAAVLVQQPSSQKIKNDEPSRHVELNSSSKLGSCTVTENEKTSVTKALTNESATLSRSKTTSSSITSTKYAAAGLSSTSLLYWKIHGVTYDLSSYVDQHPGGREAILLGQGRDDCTALFQSYHPFTAAQAVQILRKYRVPGKEKKSSSSISGSSAKQQQHDDFYETLCQRVAQTLRNDYRFDPIRDRAATPRRALYYGVVLSAVAASGFAHCRGSIIGSFLFAVFGWLIGALGHDAGHFAASRRPWINDVAVWGMSLLCNPIMWQHQHTFAHHSHTNSFDHDPDLHHFVTFLRVHRRFQQSDLYKYQSNRFFVFFAYTFVVFGTCFWVPWGMITEGSLYGMVEWTDRERPWRTAGLFLHLVVYTIIVLLLPFWVHSTWLSALTAVVLHVATSGLMFAIFSQINHLNEGSLDPNQFAKRNASRDDALNRSWAVQQIETSNNFCADSALWHVLSNGLNLQIEHHLFPGLNHCHLHLIQPTVQAACEEHGVCYKSYSSWGDLMNATLSWLDRLATEAVLDDKDT